MVTLVEDQQAEVTQFARIEGRRVIRDDRNRLQLFLAAAEEPNFVNL